MKIRIRKNPSGRLSYQLDLGIVSGRRIRKTFQFKADAQAALVGCFGGAGRTRGAERDGGCTGGEVAP